jgi:Tfp pilus assembly protein PilF
MTQATTVVDEQARAAAEPSGKTSSWSSEQIDTILVGSLLLLTLICYANVLGNGFVYDDSQQILENPYVKSWRFLHEIFTTTVWSFVGEAGTTNYYRPLMTLSYLLLWKVFGPLPFGFHLFSIAVHTAAVVMVFYTGLRIFGDLRVGWCAAVLFAVHPVHTEAVAWIAALPDLEATFLLLLAVWFLASPELPTWRQQLALSASFLGALLAKEPSLMLVPLAVAFHHGVCQNGATAFAEKIRHYLALCMVGVGYLLLRLWLFGNPVPVLQHPKITWPVASYSGFALLVSYARLLVWPWPLSAFHVFHASTSIMQPAVLAGMGIAIALVGGILALRRIAPPAAFALLWIGVTLVPVLNARWMAANVLTERYLYLPSVGFCWVLGWLAVRLWDSTSVAGTLELSPLRIALASGLIATAIAGTTLTVVRNRDWHTDFSLYSRTLQTDPDAHIIRSNLAGVYLDARDLERAEREWKIALAGKPDNVVTMNALGILYNEEKRYAEAEEITLRAISAKPSWGVPHWTYAVTLRSTGRPDLAAIEFAKAMQLSPLNASIRLAYAKALVEDRRYTEAAAEFRESLDLQPSDEALTGLASVYVETGQAKQAIATLEALVKDAPFDAAAHLKLAKLLESNGQRVEAIAEYRSTLATDPANAEAASGLARLRMP